jgi:hypothetical protein
MQDETGDLIIRENLVIMANEEILQSGKIDGKLFTGELLEKLVDIEIRNDLSPRSLSEHLKLLTLLRLQAVPPPSEVLGDFFADHFFSLP